MSTIDLRPVTAGGGNAVPGWYPDPVRRFPHRYWDGQCWTARVAVGGACHDDPVRVGPEPSQHTYLDFVRDYLVAARRRGVIDDRALRPLVEDLDAWERAPLLPPPDPAHRVASPGPAAVAAASPAATPVMTPPQPAARPAARPVVQPAARPVVQPATQAESEPGRVGQWMAQVRRSITDDLAVHGLADLGALLLFAGLFGFVAFAFGEVRVGLRPVAELAIPATLLAIGAFLRRRGTRVIGDALVLLGGALLPVVAIASFSDGASVPPDLTGTALVLTLVGVLIGTSVLEALAARRDPSTPLRFLIAPTAWLAVAAAGLGLDRAVPGGSDLATPTAPQWSLVTAAVAASLLLAAVVLPKRLAGPVRAASWPGLAIAYALTLLAAAGDGWPPLPLLVAGLAAIVGLEVLLGGSAVVAATSLQATVLVLTAAALAPAWGVGWVAVGAGAIALVAAEVRHRNGAPRRLVTVVLWGTTVVPAACLATLGESGWPLVVAAGTGWLWAVARSMRPGPIGPRAAAVVVWVMPVLATAGLAVETSVGTAGLVLSAVIAAVAVLGRLWHGVRLPVWDQWVPVGAAAALAWQLAGPDAASWTGVMAAGLTSVAFALAPRWPVVRMWSSAAAAVIAGCLILVVTGSSATVTAGTLAAAGVLAVALGEARRTRLGGHLGVVGELLALAGWAVAIGVPVDGDRTPAIGAVTTVAVLGAFGTSATIEALRGSSVSDLLVRIRHRLAPTPLSAPDQAATGIPQGSRVDRALRLVPLAVAVAVAPFAVVAAVDAATLLAYDSGWTIAIAVAVMTLATAGARLTGEAGRPAARLVVNEGTAAAAVVSLLSLADPWAAVAAMALLVAQPFVAGERLRRAVTVWIAVAASGALALELAAALALPTARLQAVLLAWGGVVLVGGLTLDARRTRSAERPRRWTAAALLAPVVLGTIALMMALALAPAQGVTVTAWSCLAAAAIVAAAAVLAGASFLTGISWTLLTVWAAALSPWPPQDDPWVWVVWTTALLAAAEVLTHVTPTGRPALLRNWALPAAVVAHGAALVGLGQATSVGWVPATWCGIGGLSILFGIRVRRVEWPIVGTALVLGGAAVAGPGWLALALLATSVTAGVGVTRTTGAARTSLRVAVAVTALGAWASFGTWQDWDVLTSTSVTTIAAGALIACAGIALRARLLDRPGAVGVAGPALAALAVVLPWWIVDGTPRSPSGFALVGGTALVAVGFSMAAQPAAWRWLREAGAVALVTSLLLLLGTVGPTAGTVVGVSAVLGVLAAAAVVATLRMARFRPWVRPEAIVAVASLAVMSAAAAAARPGWQVLAAATATVVALALATQVGGAARRALQVMTVAAGGVTWLAIGRWAGWDADAFVSATAVLGAVLVLGLAVVVRLARPTRDWTLMALVPGCAAVGGSTAALALPAVDRGVAGIWVAAALGAAAAAAALAARPTGVARLRELTAVLGLGAVAVLLDGLGADLRATAITSAVIALAATGGLMLTGVMDRGEAWVRALGLTTLVATAGAWVGAFSGGEPSLGMAEMAILLTGTELAAVGVARKRPALVDAAPSIFCLAWIVFAVESLAGEPSWVTVPAGATLLLTVSLARHQRRVAGATPATPLLTALEVMGMALLVASPLVQSIVSSLAYVPLLIVLGAALVAWGSLSRVRRRLVGGAATVVAGVAILVLVPMVDVARRVTGVWVWLAVAGVGLVAILVAAFLEQSRSAIRRTVRRVRDLTADWE